MSPIVRGYKKRKLILDEQKLRKEAEDELSKAKAELVRKQRLVSIYKEHFFIASQLQKETQEENSRTELFKREEELRVKMEYHIRNSREIEEKYHQISAALHELAQKYEAAENVITNQECLIKQLQALNSEKTAEIKTLQESVHKNKKNVDLTSSCQPRYVSSLKHAIAFGELLQKKVPLTKKKKLWISNAGIWLEQLGEKKIKLDTLLENGKNKEAKIEKQDDSSFEVADDVIDDNASVVSKEINKDVQQNLAGKGVNSPSSSSSWTDEGIGSPQMSVISQLSNCSETSYSSSKSLASVCSSTDSGIVLNTNGSKSNSCDSGINEVLESDKNKENKESGNKLNLITNIHKQNALPDLSAEGLSKHVKSIFDPELTQETINNEGKNYKENDNMCTEVHLMTNKPGENSLPSLDGICRSSEKYERNFIFNQDSLLKKSVEKKNVECDSLRDQNNLNDNKQDKTSLLPLLVSNPSSLSRDSSKLAKQSYEQEFFVEEINCKSNKIDRKNILENGESKSHIIMGVGDIVEDMNNVLYEVEIADSVKDSNDLINDLDISITSSQDELNDDLNIFDCVDDADKSLNASCVTKLMDFVNNESIECENLVTDILNVDNFSSSSDKNVRSLNDGSRINNTQESDKICDRVVSIAGMSHCNISSDVSYEVNNAIESENKIDKDKFKTFIGNSEPVSCKTIDYGTGCIKVLKYSDNIRAVQVIKHESDISSVNHFDHTYMSVLKMKDESDNVEIFKKPLLKSQINNSSNEIPLLLNGQIIDHSEEFSKNQLPDIIKDTNKDNEVELSLVCTDLNLVSKPMLPFVSNVNPVSNGNYAAVQEDTVHGHNGSKASGSSDSNISNETVNSDITKELKYDANTRLSNSTGCIVSSFIQTQVSSSGVSFETVISGKIDNDLKRTLKLCPPNVTIDDLPLIEVHENTDKSLRTCDNCDETSSTSSITDKKLYEPENPGVLIDFVSEAPVDKVNNNFELLHLTSMKCNKEKFAVDTKQKFEVFEKRNAELEVTTDSVKVDSYSVVKADIVTDAVLDLDNYSSDQNTKDLNIPSKVDSITEAVHTSADCKISVDGSKDCRSSGCKTEEFLTSLTGDNNFESCVPGGNDTIDSLSVTKHFEDAIFYGSDESNNGEDNELEKLLGEIKDFTSLSYERMVSPMTLQSPGKGVARIVPGCSSVGRRTLLKKTSRYPLRKTDNVPVNYIHVNKNHIEDAKCVDKLLSSTSHDQEFNEENKPAPVVNDKISVCNSNTQNDYSVVLENNEKSLPSGSFNDKLAKPNKTADNKTVKLISSHNSDNGIEDSCLSDIFKDVFCPPLVSFPVDTIFDNEGFSSHEIVIDDNKFKADESKIVDRAPAVSQLTNCDTNVNDIATNVKPAVDLIRKGDGKNGVKQIKPLRKSARNKFSSSDEGDLNNRKQKNKVEKIKQENKSNVADDSERKSHCISPPSKMCLVDKLDNIVIGNKQVQLTCKSKNLVKDVCIKPVSFSRKSRKQKRRERLKKQSTLVDSDENYDSFSDLSDDNDSFVGFPEGHDMSLIKEQLNKIKCISNYFSQYFVDSGLDGKLLGANKVLISNVSQNLDENFNAKETCVINKVVSASEPTEKKEKSTENKALSLSSSEDKVCAFSGLQNKVRRNVFETKEQINKVDDETSSVSQNVSECKDETSIIQKIEKAEKNTNCGKSSVTGKNKGERGRGEENRNGDTESCGAVRRSNRLLSKTTTIRPEKKLESPEEKSKSKKKTGKNSKQEILKGCIVSNKLSSDDTESQCHEPKKLKTSLHICNLSQTIIVKESITDDSSKQELQKVSPNAKASKRGRRKSVKEIKSASHTFCKYCSDTSASQLMNQSLHENFCSNSTEKAGESCKIIDKHNGQNFSQSKLSDDKEVAFCGVEENFDMNRLLDLGNTDKQTSSLSSNKLSNSKILSNKNLITISGSLQCSDETESSSIGNNGFSPCLKSELKKRDEPNNQISFDIKLPDNETNVNKQEIQNSESKESLKSNVPVNSFQVPESVTPKKGLFNCSVPKNTIIEINLKNVTNSFRSNFPPTCNESENLFNKRKKCLIQSDVQVEHQLGNNASHLPIVDNINKITPKNSSSKLNNQSKPSIWTQNCVKTADPTISIAVVKQVIKPHFVSESSSVANCSGVNSNFNKHYGNNIQPGCDLLKSSSLFHTSKAQISDNQNCERLKSPLNGVLTDVSSSETSSLILSSENSTQKSLTENTTNDFKNGFDIPSLNFYSNVSDTELHSRKRKLSQSFVEDVPVSIQSPKKLRGNDITLEKYNEVNNFLCKLEDVEEKIACCDTLLKTAFNYHKPSLLACLKEEITKLKLKEARDCETAEDVLGVIQQLCTEDEPLSQELLDCTVDRLKTCGQKTVAEMFVDLLCIDSEHVVEDSVPPLSPLQRYLFPVAYNLSCDSNYSDFLSTFIGSVKSTLFSSSEKCLVVPSQNLAKFSTLLCRSLQRFNEMRWFMYDVLYMLRYRASPIIHTMLLHWPSLMPYAQNAKDCPLSFCIGRLICNQKVKPCYAKLYKDYDLKNVMKRLYGYDLGEMTSDQAFENLLKFINYKGFTEAIILLCKREGCDWTITKINKTFLPMLDSWRNGSLDENTAFIIIITLGYILRPFPRNAAEQITHQVVTQLERILVNLEGSPRIHEAAAISVCHLSRLNFEFCIDVLQKWKPKDGEFSKNVIDTMKLMIAVKKPIWWQKYFSNCSF